MCFSPQVKGWGRTSPRPDLDTTGDPWSSYGLWTWRIRSICGSGTLSTGTVTLGCLLFVRVQSPSGLGARFQRYSSSTDFGLIYLLQLQGFLTSVHLKPGFRWFLCTIDCSAEPLAFTWNLCAHPTSYPLSYDNWNCLWIPHMSTRQ